MTPHEHKRRPIWTETQTFLSAFRVKDRG